MNHFLLALTILLGNVSIAHAIVLMTKEAYMDRFLSKVNGETIRARVVTADLRQQVETSLGSALHPQETYVLHIRYQDEAELNSCIFITEHGKHGEILFGITLDNKGSIVDMSVLESKEVRGRKIAKNRFLKQFIGKTRLDPLQLRQDIDGITGATISSKAAAMAAKTAVVIWSTLHP